VRGEALRVTQMPYVEAARAAGAKDLQLVLRHALPNVMPPIFVQATISLAFAILAEAGLSLLGLGTHSLRRRPGAYALGHPSSGIAQRQAWK